MRCHCNIKEHANKILSLVAHGFLRQDFHIEQYLRLHGHNFFFSLNELILIDESERSVYMNPK